VSTVEDKEYGWIYVCPDWPASEWFSQADTTMDEMGGFQF